MVLYDFYYLFSHGGKAESRARDGAATMNDACSGGPWAAIEAIDASGIESLQSLMGGADAE